MPKVSIIVPAYNAEKALARCIDSILAQDYRDFELLLMDDGSKDTTPQICDEYAAKDPRVRVVHKPNSGVSDTRNQALAMAEGEFIQFLDADDWITPEATGLFVRTAEEHNADMVISDFYRVVKNWTSHKGSIEEEGVLTREEFADWMAKSPADYYYGVIWNKFYRRSIIRENDLKMDKNLHWCEDFIFNMEYILHTSRIYVLRVPTYYYVKTEGSLVAQGMKVGKIVRMKLNVIEYYSNFYKNIFSADDYALRRPEIYSFLIDYSHDDAALPLMPGSQKLGEERTLSLHEDTPAGFWACSYFEQRMYERYFRTAAERFDLDYKSVLIIMFLHNFGTVGDIRELAEYVGTNPIAVAALIERLALKEYVFVKNGLPQNAVLTARADELCRILDDAAGEVEDAELDGLTDEERKLCRKYRAAAFRNLKERMER